MMARFICRLFGHRVYVAKNEPIIPAFFVCARCGKGEHVIPSRRVLGEG